MDQYSFERGKRDALREKSPLWKRTKNGIVTDIDDPMSDFWSEDQKLSYVEGYATGLEEFDEFHYTMKD